MTGATAFVMPQEVIGEFQRIVELDVIGDESGGTGHFVELGGRDAELVVV